ncbi:transcriptional-regulating factor 1 [Sardina pilchardus]|uniref:transcriptional-regulating factor 1 n=1 Tax=Sardina pilchardus TaxID=27697 RepID=UPI002E0D50F3
MGDQSAFESHLAESHPFQALMSRVLAHPAPRLSRDPFGHCSPLAMGGVVGGHFGEGADGVDGGEAGGEGYPVGGLEQQQESPVGWGGQASSSSSSSSSSAVMPSGPRGRSQVEEYRDEWAYNGYRGGGGGGGGGEDGVGGNQQKLDSFSEAFFRRSLVRQYADADALFGMKGIPEGSVSDFPLPSLSNTSFSFPHVLSPPPTPLPSGPVSSPPRRMHLPASSQAAVLPPGSSQHQHQHQLDLSCSGPVQFFPALQPFYPASQSPTLTAKFPLHHWLQQGQGADPRGREPTPPVGQGRDSLLYPDEEFHLKHLDAGQHNDYGSADCGLQTPISSPLPQYPQSCTKPLLGPDAVSSASHMTWSTVVPCSVPSLLPVCMTSLTPHLQTNGHRAGEEVRPCVSSQMLMSQPVSHTHIQNVSPQVYTGAPFKSILQASREVDVLAWDGMTDATLRYTPQPMLNPQRRGTGLFSSLAPLSTAVDRDLSTGDGERALLHRGINIGPEFQAELPSLLTRDAEEDDDEDELDTDEPLSEQLWKPSKELDNDTILQEQVERVLELCSSGAVPGGGTNVELALHCLHQCQGDIMTAVEMLLFSHPFPAGDYHYSGSDVWHLNEKRLFFKAYAMYGKEFSLISKMVKTKRVSQCVEFYYLSKRLPDKQRRQREREREMELEQEARAASVNRVPLASKALAGPAGMDGVIRTPSLATSFPCKQCGKMFYKIKSRNAHMKIHRQQQQETWTDGNGPCKNLPVTQQDQQVLVQPAQNHQLLSQNLLQNLVQSQACLTFLQNPKNHAINISPNIVPKSSPLPLYPTGLPSWEGFQGVSDSGALYYDPEVKPVLGAKGQVQWP